MRPVCKSKLGFLRIRNLQTDIPVEMWSFRNQVRTIQRIMKIQDWALGIIMLDNQKMSQKNKTIRKHDKPTDIISLPILEHAVPGRPGRLLHGWRSPFPQALTGLRSPLLGDGGLPDAGPGPLPARRSDRRVAAPDRPFASRIAGSSSV